MYGSQLARIKCRIEPLQIYLAGMSSKPYKDIVIVNKNNTEELLLQCWIDLKCEIYVGHKTYSCHAYIMMSQVHWGEKKKKSAPSPCVPPPALLASSSPFPTVTLVFVYSILCVPNVRSLSSVIDIMRGRGWHTVRLTITR